MERNPTRKIMFVGAIGTGKSSLINALIGENTFLPSFSAKAGVPIILKYGRQAECIVYFQHNLSPLQESILPPLIRDHIKNIRNGKIPPFAIGDEDVLSFSKSPYTNYSFPFESPYEKIEFCLPNTTLEAGLELIEYPWLQASSYDTKYLTIRHLAMSNVTVMVLKADSALSQEECCFISEHFKERLVFVVTRMDTIPLGEREPFIDYIQNRLRKYAQGEILFLSATHRINDNIQFQYEESGITKFRNCIQTYIYKKLMSENYFSWENLSEMTDIQSHIVYASKVLKKYQWKDTVREMLQKQLNAIIAKQNDKMLNISVVGEFSTGKSSFINALVGYELLAVNVLQGTTVAITIIEYGQYYSISLFDFDKNISIQKYNNINHLRDALFHYTTDPSFSDNISYIKVTIPSEILKQGFRIIDTPGTNSLEQWHEDITRRAITDISDISIILMDACRPMPETLVNFIGQAINENVKDSLFVANKIDTVSARERNGLIQYIQKKIKVSFGIEKPDVLPFSSVALTNVFSKDKIQIDDDCVRLTYDSLQSIFSCTVQRRIKAQAKRTLQLIVKMYLSLDENINEIANYYERELSGLVHSKQTNLGPFIEKQISKRQKQFTSSAKEEKISIATFADRLEGTAISNIENKINGCANLDVLSNYIKNGDLTSDIQKEGVSFSSQVENKYSVIKILFKNQISSFQKEFEQEFKRLKLFPVSFNITPKEVCYRHGGYIANISPVVTIITEELSKENWAMGGGAITGAAVGTAICPGVGTVLGLIAGLAMGEGLAPDTKEVKNKIISKLSIPLHTYFNSLNADCMSNFSKYINDANKKIETEIRRYRSAYNDEIQKRIDAWESQYKSVSKSIQKTKQEIVDINNRRVLIQNIITKIR